MNSLIELLDALVPLLPGEVALVLLIAAPASMAWRLHQQKKHGPAISPDHDNGPTPTEEPKSGRLWAAEAILLLPYGLVVNMVAVLILLILLTTIVPSLDGPVSEFTGDASETAGARRVVWILLLTWPLLALPLTLLPRVLRSRGPVVGYLWLVCGPARVWLWVLRSVHWHAWKFLRLVPLIGLGAFAITDTTNKWHNQHGRGWTGQTNTGAGCVLAVTAFFLVLPYYAIMFVMVMAPTILLIEVGDQDGGWYAADLLRRLLFGPADLNETSDMAGWAFLFAPLWLTVSGIAGGWARRGIRGPWREVTAILAHMPLGEGAPMAPYADRQNAHQKA